MLGSVEENPQITSCTCTLLNVTKQGTPSRIYYNLPDLLRWKSIALFVSWLDTVYLPWHTIVPTKLRHVPHEIATSPSRDIKRPQYLESWVTSDERSATNWRETTFTRYREKLLLVTYGATCITKTYISMRAGRPLRRLANYGPVALKSEVSPRRHIACTGLTGINYVLVEDDGRVDIDCDSKLEAHDNRSVFWRVRTKQELRPSYAIIEKDQVGLTVEIAASRFGVRWSRTRALDRSPFLISNSAQRTLPQPLDTVFRHKPLPRHRESLRRWRLKTAFRLP